MSLSSTVPRGQQDTKYTAFELLLHTVFVSDDISCGMPEPTCRLNKLADHTVAGLNLLNTDVTKKGALNLNWLYHVFAGTLQAGYQQALRRRPRFSRGKCRACWDVI